MSSFSIDLFGYELAIVSMFRNTTPYLKEWIEYHQMLGVDHFWLYNDASTDDWEGVLKPYTEKGLVEVFYWPAGKPDWVPRQTEAFRDGLSRAIGVAKWVALIDQDEFIVPMQDKTIIDCLNNHFSKAPAVYVNWRNFGTNYVTLGEQEFMLSRLVKCSLKNHSRNCVGKSIIQPQFANINEMWSPHFCPLKEEFDYCNGDAGKTLAMDGIDLITDGKNHSKFIAINHYAFRDEKYFNDVRLPRDPNPDLMIRMEEEFNVMYDYKILELIKINFPEIYNAKWKGPYDHKVKSK